MAFRRKSREEKLERIHALMTEKFNPWKATELAEEIRLSAEEVDPMLKRSAANSARDVLVLGANIWKNGGYRADAKRIAKAFHIAEKEFEQISKEAEEVRKEIQGARPFRDLMVKLALRREPRASLLMH